MCVPEDGPQRVYVTRSLIPGLELSHNAFTLLSFPELASTKRLDFLEIFSPYASLLPSLHKFSVVQFLCWNLVS